MELDPSSPSAHALLGFALGFRRQHDASLDELARATALNPNYTDWRYTLAFVVAGEHSRAVAAARAHMRADPFYPPRAALWLGVAYFMLKRYQEALPYLREVVSRVPKSRGAHVWAAASYAQLGQLENARREAAEVLRIDAHLTVEFQRRLEAFAKIREISTTSWMHYARRDFQRTNPEVSRFREWVGSRHCSAPLSNLWNQVRVIFDGFGMSAHGPLMP